MSFDFSRLCEALGTAIQDLDPQPIDAAGGQRLHQALDDHVALLARGSISHTHRTTLRGGGAPSA
jgi:aromatic ring-opening dioxygenase catalytic subunit (LigB family)